MSDTESKLTDDLAQQQNNAKLLALLQNVKMSADLDISEISACLLVDTSEMRLGLVVRVLELKGRLENTDTAFTINCGQCSEVFVCV